MAVVNTNTSNTIYPTGQITAALWP